MALLEQSTSLWEQWNEYTPQNWHDALHAAAVETDGLEDRQERQGELDQVIDLARPAFATRQEFVDFANRISNFAQEEWEIGVRIGYALAMTWPKSIREVEGWPERARTYLAE